MENKHPKNAQHIKAQLIDFILNNYEKGIIATEVPVESKQSIIDILFIGNDTLIGFEIKSDFDTNIRLERQIDNYYGAFNQLYLVCGENFYKKNRLIRNGVGIIIANNDSLRVKKKAFHRKFPSKNKMVNFLWKSDLPYTALKDRVGVSELKQRAVNEIPTKDLFRMTIKALTNRYRQRFDSFLKARGAVTFIQDVDVLTIQDHYL